MHQVVTGIWILAITLSVNGTALAALVDYSSERIFDKGLNTSNLDQSIRSRYGDNNFGKSWQNAMVLASELNESSLSVWRLDGSIPVSRSRRSKDGVYLLDIHDAYNWDKACTFDFIGGKKKGMHESRFAYRFVDHDGDLHHPCPISAVPIPTTLSLLISGLLSIWLFLRQSRMKEVR
jgi:hypothetical protein